MQLTGKMWEAHRRRAWHGEGGEAEKCRALRMIHGREEGKPRMLAGGKPTLRLTLEVEPCLALLFLLGLRKGKHVCGRMSANQGKQNSSPALSCRGRGDSILAVTCLHSGLNLIPARTVEWKRGPRMELLMVVSYCVGAGICT